MSLLKTFTGVQLPNIDASEMSGRLIVIEGTDGVGRTTQIKELKAWLEVQGYGVIVAGLARSPLIARAIEQAKEGHSLNVYTFSLLYLADFADCLEHTIIPALRAGYIVLADRYVYTAFARSVVRGASPAWIRSCYGFAPLPSAVLYMRIRIKDLIPRVLNSENLAEGYWRQPSQQVMDYWESGMDMKLGEDFYDSFVAYQKCMIAEFDAMAREFGFVAVDASRSFRLVNNRLKSCILHILEESVVCV
jgi:dTMP kinase